KPMSTDDTMLDELLGAYALDAVEPDEAVAVEAYLERSPGAADEVARLRKAAAWIGATEALAPPPALHDTVLDAARARRGGRHDAGDDPFLAVSVSEGARLDALLDEVPESGWNVRTFNGLTVRELVTHLASMESTVASVIGSPTVPDVTELDVERRTAIFLARFRDRPLPDVRAVWRESVEALRVWVRRAPRARRLARVRAHARSRFAARHPGLRDLDARRRHPPGRRAPPRAAVGADAGAHGRPVGHLDAGRPRGRRPRPPRQDGPRRPDRWRRRRLADPPRLRRGRGHARRRPDRRRGRLVPGRVGADGARGPAPDRRGRPRPRRRSRRRLLGLRHAVAPNGAGKGRHNGVGVAVIPSRHNERGDPADRARARAP